MIIHIIAHNEVSTRGIELVYILFDVCAILSKKFPKPSVSSTLYFKVYLFAVIIVFLLCSRHDGAINYNILYMVFRSSNIFGNRWFRFYGLIIPKYT
jgi:hypothetical protein